MGYRSVTTIVTAASSYDLATLADVKAELSITDTDSDALLGRYIRASSKAIEQYCNRVFARETIKDEFWPDREPYAFQLTTTLKSLQLSRWPVGAVTSVTENGVALTENTEFRVENVAGALWRLDDLAYPNVWRSWPIIAIYDGGYQDIPDDVQDAAIRLVKARYLARGRDPFLKSEDIPGVRSVQYWVATGDDAGNLPPDVSDILSNYRQVVSV
ncbi:hypothetical protein GOZ97_07435 [Agrobacterium vitis]|uniref:phage head-tail connector protein n=1 Tax=Agrobacterium vitis TaxID=373 RepID=UPI0008FB498A|nr:phage head-tail connector protein [Agrobacterium vitis]MUZ53031.1 hypothetical protein [Agrobacterium vitis]MUZ91250.1 hypothetical protein [Agrobacterium vitis]MVA40306.1 hypothetical protein [Agrobacterium vitis]NSX96152.1 hypothetical protein [Agrobacterium vitis]NSZ27291.1 hypothetical protein [Agrobacterium vitis]